MNFWRTICGRVAQSRIFGEMAEHDGKEGITC
jgi:hypothetical protein